MMLGAAVIVFLLGATEGARSVEVADSIPAATLRLAPPAGSVVAGKKKSRRVKPAPTAQGAVGGFSVRWDLEAQAAAGAMQGLGVVRRAGGATELRAESDLRITRGMFSLQWPVELRQRTLAGLYEARGSSGVKLTLRPWRWLRLVAGGEVAGRLRPDWPDPYQPDLEGRLTPTSRRSRWDRKVGGRISLGPWSGVGARIRYSYRLRNHLLDPDFEAIDSPNHLTPYDTERHRLNVEAYWRNRSYRVEIGSEFFHTNYSWVFARDPGTGLTHAGPGGQPPNPLQVVRGMEPRIEGRSRFLWRELEARVGYGLELVDDVFAGYYSYLGHHPWAGFRWKKKRFLVEARLDVWLRLYGSGSYAPGPNHPPLRYGTRRSDVRGRATLKARHPLGERIDGFFEGSLTARRTNFPNYEPGVFPRQRNYDIEWDYANWLVLTGVNFRL